MTMGSDVRVVLCVPNHSFRVESHAPFSTEHLGVAYLAAELASKGHSVEVIDAYLLDLSPVALAEVLCSGLADDDLVCFTTTFETCRYVESVCRAIRSKGFEGAVVVGGWGIAVSPRCAASYFSSASVLWCGWDASEFAAALGGITSSTSSHGPLVFGLPPQAHPRPPRVSWSRPYHYVHALDEYARFRSAPLPVLGGVGCYWGSCSFCCTAKRWSTGVCQRNAKEITDEIRDTMELHGVTQFAFVDDCFFDGTDEGRRRAITLCRLFMSMGTLVEFSMDCRVVDVEERLFAFLRDSGLTNVFLGIESGSPGVLRRYNKGHSVEQCRRALGILRQLGIGVSLGYITFEPRMSLLELSEAIGFLSEHFPDELELRIRDALTLYPSTPIFSELDKEGLVVGQFPDYMPCFSDPYVEEIYRTVAH